MRRLFIILYSLFFASIVYANSAKETSSIFSSKPEVKEFINEMVKNYKFSKPELVAIFDAVKPRPIVTKHISVPSESKPWYLYQARFVNDKRIQQGVDFWNQYEEVLTRAEETFGIPASIIVATIGVETKYGRDRGAFRVIDALVNLAFSDSPRAPYFRKELVDFLLLTREQHLDALKVTGSYAGAIGQPQFMPSSYRNYAINFSGGSSIDLSNNEADVIGSIANYYAKNGWKNGEPVTFPASIAGSQFQISLARPKPISLSELLDSGFISKAQLTTNKKSSILTLRANYGTEYWYTFHNFNVIKRYNHSDLYAMAVYQLSYYITVMREYLKNE